MDLISLTSPFAGSGLLAVEANPGKLCFWAPAGHISEHPEKPVQSDQASGKPEPFETGLSRLLGQYRVLTKGNRSNIYNSTSIP